MLNSPSTPTSSTSTRDASTVDGPPELDQPEPVESSPAPRPVDAIRADLAAAQVIEPGVAAVSTRLVADVVPLLAEVERLTAELAETRAHWSAIHEVDLARASAGQRALEAVRAQVADARLIADELLRIGVTDTFKIAHRLRAALSAASPTTIDAGPKPIEFDDPEATYHAPTNGSGVCCAVVIGGTFDRVSARRANCSPEPAASDEPARCPHGRTGPHTYPSGSSNVLALTQRDCPGPAASGTPEATR